MRVPVIAFSALAAAVMCSGAYAAANRVASPDGRTVFTVDCVDGRPFYTVSLDGAAFIEDSPLGLKANTGDFTRGLRITSVSPTTAVTDSYSLPNIKKAG